MLNRQSPRRGGRNMATTGRAAGAANLIGGPAAGTRGATAQPQLLATPPLTARATRAAARALPSEAAVQAPISVPNQVERALNQNTGRGNQRAVPQAPANPQTTGRTTRAAAAAAAQPQATAVLPSRRILRPRPPMAQVQASIVAPNQATQILNPNLFAAPQTRTQPARGLKRDRPDDDDNDGDDDGNAGVGPRKQQFTRKGKAVLGLPQQTKNGKIGPPTQPSVTGPNIPVMIAEQPGDEVKERIWEQEGADGDPMDIDPLGGIEDDQRTAWLASSRRWKGRWFGANWVGKKILGLGANGLIGLWEHTNPASADITVDRPTKVVVKQSKKSDSNLKNEGKLLNILKKQASSKHIVWIYGNYYEERGQGTIMSTNPMAVDEVSERLDPKTKVGRIYLEYCENGDMLGVIKLAFEKYSDNTPVPEEMIWSIFECLARALCVLAYGSENVDGPLDATWRPVAHFDIKTDNIFGGPLDDEHPKYHIMKLADFGLSIQLPLDPGAQTKRWYTTNYAKERGTLGYRPPEQTDDTMADRFQGIGTKSNVWQIAKCIYELIRVGREFSCEKTFLFKPDPTSQEIRTFGRKLLTKDVYDHYSMELKVLVLKCLAYKHIDRPDPRELLKTCQTVSKDMKAAEELLAAKASAPGPSRRNRSRAPRHPEPGDGDLEMGGV